MAGSVLIVVCGAVIVSGRPARPGARFQPHAELRCFPITERE